MKEYRATFRRIDDGEQRHPSFQIQETDHTGIVEAAFNALFAIPFLGGDRREWELLNVVPDEARYSAPRGRKESNYLVLVEVIIERLQRGDYAPDHPFMTQNEIRIAFQATKRAVLLAVHTLVDRGYLEMRGSGSNRRYFVRPRRHWNKSGS